jgi:hypothetical protein
MGRASEELTNKGGGDEEEGREREGGGNRDDKIIRGERDRQKGRMNGRKVGGRRWVEGVPR